MPPCHARAMSFELSPHPVFTRRPGPVVLCVLDGVGLGQGEEDDAVASARTPNLDRMMATCPHLALRAHGTAVGLPSDDDLGNSEVGHNAMGAGRIFDQGAKLVNAAFESGRAWESETWRELTKGNTLHLLGLVSDGNVHSHVEHLNALIDRAAKDGVKRLRVHVLTDGRDVGARSALIWLEPLEEKLRTLSTEGRDYSIASGGGRMHITMDRYEADWDMVERGYRCHVEGKGRVVNSASEAIRTAYAENPKIDDQYIPAFVVEGSRGTIGDGDSVLLFNFRGDRAIEISRALGEDDFTAFDRGPRPKVFFAGMMEYDGDLHIPKNYLVAPPEIDRTVGQFLAAAKIRSFACSETQKYGHVTYFYNGNRSGKIDATLETYLEIPSDRVSFELRPWMKAAEITDAAVTAIESGDYDYIRLNYANGDMVGHTGDLEATRIAMEVVDRQLARLEDAVNKTGGILLITADHGNADEMYTRDKKGAVQRNAEGIPAVRTSHTTNPVPFIVVDPKNEIAVREDLEKPGIANLGATILSLLGLTPPPDYLESLVKPRPR
jgi:2,3-bisphosphoglycerate-independent phosphoglycerate mutase